MKASTEARVRVDKWLWAARFFKTRGQATEAIQGGRVHVNGQRVKPARPIQIGDTLEIQKGRESFTVVIEGIADRRGSASVAQTLYRETLDSITARTRYQEDRRLYAASGPHPEHRPDKKSRRQLLRMKSGKGT